MMNSLVRSLAAWNLVRWIRFGLGTSLLIQGIVYKDSLSGLFGALLFYQAITNTGCCGVSGCTTDHNPKNSSQDSITEFVEIKSKTSESIKQNSRS